MKKSWAIEANKNNCKNKNVKQNIAMQWQSKLKQSKEEEGEAILPLYIAHCIKVDRVRNVIYTFVSSYGK